MTHTEDIPTLRIVPTDCLVLHEYHDSQRSLPLVERLRREGVLKNPPIVAPLGEGDRRCVVLDGANRTTAARHLGLAHFLVQVVDYESAEQVRLSTWHHVVAGGLEREEFQRLLAGVEGLALQPADPLHARAALARRDVMAYIVLPDGAVLTAQGGRDLYTRTQILNRLVDTYKDSARIHRTTSDRLSDIAHLYADITALVVFPHHEPVEILALARDGAFLPAGITRHIIQGRALRLDYPLSELAADAPLEEKNRRLQEWVTAKLAEKEIRYYPESTYLFDE